MPSLPPTLKRFSVVTYDKRDENFQEHVKQLYHMNHKSAELLLGGVY